MRFFFCLALLVPSVLSSITSNLISSTSTTEVCSTRQTSTHAKIIPTSTVYKSAPPVIIVAHLKSTPVQTVTPQVFTSTQTVIDLVTYTFTASVITDVFSTTSTFYETDTETQSITNVVVITETSSTTVVATAVITTPPGFISIDTSTGEENIGQSPARKRTDSHPHAPGKQAEIKGVSPGVERYGGFCDNDQIYPAAVKCKCYLLALYKKKDTV